MFDEDRTDNEGDIVKMLPVIDTSIADPFAVDGVAQPGYRGVLSRSGERAEVARVLSTEALCTNYRA